MKTECPDSTKPHSSSILTQSLNIVKKGLQGFCQFYSFATKTAYSNAGGFSALAGSLTGIAARLSNNIRPFEILNSNCGRGLAQSFDTLIATPMSSVTGGLMLCIRPVYELLKIDEYAQSGGTPESRDAQTAAQQRAKRHAGIVGFHVAFLALLPTTLKIIRFLPSWLTSDVTNQVLYGMSAATAIDGLVTLGRTSMAKVVIVLSAVGFGLLNLGFFSHKTAECQDIHTTYAHLLGAPIIAGLGALANKVMKPYYKEISKKLNNFVNSRSSKTFAQSLEPIFQNQNIILSRGDDGSLCWWKPGSFNCHNRIPAIVVPQNIEAPNWLTKNHRLVISEQVGEPRYTFVLEKWNNLRDWTVVHDNSSDDIANEQERSFSHASNPKTFGEHITAELNKPVPASPLNLIWDGLKIAPGGYLVVRFNEEQQPIWYYGSEHELSLIPVPSNLIPKVGFDFHGGLNKNFAIEIRLNREWNVYEYSVRRIDTNQIVSMGEEENPSLPGHLLQINPQKDPVNGIHQDTRVDANVEAVLLNSLRPLFNRGAHLEVTKAASEGDIYLFTMISQEGQLMDLGDCQPPKDFTLRQPMPFLEILEIHPKAYCQGLFSFITDWDRNTKLNFKNIEDVLGLASEKNVRITVKWTAPAQYSASSWQHSNDFDQKAKGPTVISAPPGSSPLAHWTGNEADTSSNDHPFPSSSSSSSSPSSLKPNSSASSMHFYGWKKRAQNRSVLPEEPGSG